jgi:aminodeoxyfutalosine synthase
LFNSTDLLALGWVANRERERRHGARTFFNHNLRLEATNVCEASCLFLLVRAAEGGHARLAHHVGGADPQQASAA